MPEYTVLSALSLLIVIALEAVWKTGIFKELQYWLAMVIVFSFQTLVDGWLTKLRDPIVLYSDKHFLTIRFPWDIPIEDFAFGFSMVTATILVWRRLGRKDETHA